MIKILVKFLAGDTPYKPGDIVWIDKEEYERLSKEGKVEKYKETMFYPLEGRTEVIEGVEANFPQKPFPKKNQEEELICPLHGEKHKTKKSLKEHLKKCGIEE